MALGAHFLSHFESLVEENMLNRSELAPEKNRLILVAVV